jgi:hypothetical protein
MSLDKEDARQNIRGPKSHFLNISITNFAVESIRLMVDNFGIK